MARRAPQSQDKFIIRLPDGMRDKIEALAKANKRTMTGEIIARLEASFREPAANSLETRVSELEGRVLELECEVRDLTEDQSKP